MVHRSACRGVGCGPSASDPMRSPSCLPPAGHPAMATPVGGLDQVLQAAWRDLNASAEHLCADIAAVEEDEGAARHVELAQQCLLSMEAMLGEQPCPPQDACQLLELVRREVGCCCCWRRPGCCWRQETRGWAPRCLARRCRGLRRPRPPRPAPSAAGAAAGDAAAAAGAPRGCEAA